MIRVALHAIAVLVGYALANTLVITILTLFLWRAIKELRK